MVYRFSLISDEVDHFLREIQIDSEATFLDFHKAILSSVGYPDDQMTSFFICSDNWEKETEVTLEDMGVGSDEDSWVMGETTLSELIEDEKQRLIYVFDPLAERVFFIELSEIITGKHLKAPVCTKKEGEPPVQTLDYDQLMNIGSSNSTSLDLDDDFGDDSGFDLDELDPEGMDIIDDSFNASEDLF